jgi:predicted Zn-dependent protease with MMP-like domain
VDGLSPDVFMALVADALEGLPQAVHDALDNVEVVTQEWPSPDQLDYMEGDDRYALLGLYEGIPLSDRVNYTMVLPDKVTLFQRPLEAVCATQRELEHEVQVTVVHELAHHLGWGDEDIHRMGFG